MIGALKPGDVVVMFGGDPLVVGELVSTVAGAGGGEYSTGAGFLGGKVGLFVSTGAGSDGVVTGFTSGVGTKGWYEDGPGNGEVGWLYSEVVIADTPLFGLSASVVGAGSIEEWADTE